MCTTLYTPKETTHTKGQYCQARWWRPHGVHVAEKARVLGHQRLRCGCPRVPPLAAATRAAEAQTDTIPDSTGGAAVNPACLSLSPLHKSASLNWPAAPASSSRRRAASHYAPFAFGRPPNARAQRHLLSTLDVCLASTAPRGVVQDGALRARLRRRGSGGRGREAKAARGVHGDGRGGARTGAPVAPAVPVLRASLGAFALPLTPPRPLHGVAVHWRQKVMPPYCLVVQCSFR